MKDLPATDLGEPLNAAQGDAVRRGTRDIVNILNSLPKDAMVPTLCSAIISFCAAQMSPTAMMVTITLTVAEGLDECEAMPVAGNA